MESDRFPMADRVYMVDETSHTHCEFTAIVDRDPDEPDKVVRMIRIRRIERSDDPGEPSSVRDEFVIPFPLVKMFRKALKKAMKACEELVEDLDVTVSG